MQTRANPVTGKIILEGIIECHSPLHIGCGTGEQSDLDILRDRQGNPLIPSTALIGVLRHTIIVDTPEQEKAIEKFWGYTKNDEGQQSSVCCSDLICQNASPTTIIRDGIKIDNTTGMAKDQGKYDYELVERGTTFSLNMEFSYQETSKAFIRQMAATIYTLLQQGQIQIGAKTNSGFGEIQLLEEQTTLYHFDFSKKKDVFDWLAQKDWEAHVIRVEALGEPFAILRNRFCIDATLQLKNSLIIRSYSADPKMPDATHITSNEDWVLTGTSLKGAIRARAERIVNTLNKPKAIITDLFGEVETEKDANTARKGRIRVREVTLPRYPAEQQTRIKIDRFTGGTIEAALFDSMPLFNDDRHQIQQVQIVVEDCHEHEAGLLLLVLKDLWSGDLAIGGEKNVGRGVFQGVNARITWKEQAPIVLQDITQLPPDQQETLQKYVDAFDAYK